MTDLAAIQQLSAAGRHQECLQACQNALQANQEETYAYKYAGKSLLALGQFEKAQQCLVKAHQLDGNDPEIVKDIGNIFLRLGNEVAALGWYEKALEINNQYAPAINNLANLKRQSGNTQEAVNLFKRAIHADPKLIQAYVGAAASFLALKDLDQAESFAAQALAINESVPGVNEILGIVFQNKSKPEQAVECYQKELEVNPQASNSLLNLGLLLLQKGQTAAAVESLAKASALAPNEQCSLFLAQAYQNLGQFKEAIVEYKKVDINQSKNKMIPFNLGLCLLNTGNNIDAEEAFKISIQLDNLFIPAWGNLGNALQREGRFKEALLATQKVLELEPDDPTALINLGSIFKDLGQLDQALTATLKSLELKPDNPDAHMNLGNIYQQLGQLDKALISTLQSLEIDSNNTNSHINLGSIYQELGQLDEALASTLKAIELKPEHPGALNNLKAFTNQLILCSANEKNLIKAYELLINLDNVSHQKLSRVYIKAFLPAIQKAAKSDPIISLNNNSFNDLAADWRLRKSLTLLIPPHRDIEDFLTCLRKELILLIADQQVIPDNLKALTEALAVQCFLNEYVYAESPEEKVLVKQLIDALSKNQASFNQYLAIVSCYVPIYRLAYNQDWVEDYKTTSYESRTLIKSQLYEPQQEERIKITIQSNAKTTNAVSTKVQGMYEENPYPRFRHADYTDKSLAQNISQSIEIESTKKKLHFAEPLTSNHSCPKVLIAGCGTGSQVISSSRYKNAQITAIDLSTSSLAYAIRKSEEYKMDNIDFKKMDILGVATLDEIFDIVECCGVLHHMEDPAKGLSALNQQLRPGGYIKLGLYSDIARQVIIKARNQIKQLGIKSTDIDIRRFRQQVLSGEFKELSKLPSFWRDFYSMSEFRDLCFHVQEHRFSTEALHNFLEAEGLIFCGFILKEEIKKTYQQWFPADTDMTSLENWGHFENQNPSTFNAMYQFWAHKPF